MWCTHLETYDDPLKGNEIWHNDWLEWLHWWYENYYPYWADCQIGNC
jgi:hypothetical protein